MSVTATARGERCGASNGFDVCTLRPGHEDDCPHFDIATGAEWADEWVGGDG